MLQAEKARMPQPCGGSRNGAWDTGIDTEAGGASRRDAGGAAGAGLRSTGPC